MKKWKWINFLSSSIGILILGDNKGISDVSGFAKSHSANSFCRFCTLRKTQTRIRTTQDDAKMRNKENYAEDVRKNNAKLTGIVEDSIINLIFLCHATLTLGIDIMHDIFEGILHYHMCAIILEFIKDPDLGFTLAKLNQLKSEFEYGEVESGNNTHNDREIEKKLTINVCIRNALLFSPFWLDRRRCGSEDR